jgi:DNA-binding NarL/FixJ family response regulator
MAKANRLATTSGVTSPAGPRILIAEDETLLAQLLSARLRATLPGASIDSVRTVAELRRYPFDHTDVVIVDLLLADGSSLEWIRSGCADHPRTKTIVLTSREDDYVLNSVFNSGVAGFVHKADGIDLLEIALKAVLAGGLFFSPKIQAMRSRLSAAPDFYAKILSVREQEIVAWVGEGLASADIACQLGLKESTVLDHRKNIMGKLGLHTQAELMTYALEKGFASFPRRTGAAPP